MLELVYMTNYYCHKYMYLMNKEGCCVSVEYKGYSCTFTYACVYSIYCCVCIVCRLVTGW